MWTSGKFNNRLITWCHYLMRLNCLIMLMEGVRKVLLILLTESNFRLWALRMFICLEIKLIYYCCIILLRKHLCKNRLFKNLNILMFLLESVLQCNWQNYHLQFNPISLIKALVSELIIIIKPAIDILVMDSSDNAQILWLRKFIVKLFLFLQFSLHW